MTSPQEQRRRIQEHRRRLDQARKDHINIMLADGVRLPLTAGRRHRPKGLESPLLREEIENFVLFARARYPQRWHQKKIIGIAQDLYGVSRAYIFRVLAEMDPCRREIIEMAAASLCHPDGWIEQLLERLAATGECLPAGFLGLAADLS